MFGFQEQRNPNNVLNVNDILSMKKFKDYSKILKEAQKTYKEAIESLGGLPKFFRSFRIGRLTITITWWKKGQ